MSRSVLCLLGYPSSKNLILQAVGLGMLGLSLTVGRVCGTLEWSQTMKEDINLLTIIMLGHQYFCPDRCLGARATGCRSGDTCRCIISEQRMQKWGKKAGMRAWLKINPHKPSVMSLFLTNPWSLVNQKLLFLEDMTMDH